MGTLQTYPMGPLLSNTHMVHYSGMDNRIEPQYKLRMPAELRDKLKKAAKENHRSMNAEMVARLQESFEMGGTKTSESDRELEDRLIARLLARMAEKQLLDEGRQLLEEGKPDE